MLKWSDTLLWIPDLSDGGNESRCCSPSMLDARHENPTSVESFPMYLEDARYANGIFVTDCPREGRIVVHIWCLFLNLQLTICTHGNCLVLSERPVK